MKTYNFRGRDWLRLLDYSREEIETILDVAFDLKRRFAAQAAQKGLHFETKVHDIPPEVVGDPVRLSQLLGNLLSNAIKFTERGRVALQIACTETVEGTVELKAIGSDTGIGMSNDVQKKLFSPFFQADQSATRRHGGTGLGLSLCKRLVDLMQGKITATSIAGQGSEFQVTLTLPKH